MGLLRFPISILVFCLFTLVQAYTVFETNCSVPVTLANYVSAPNTRSTLDILWSSLFTIFACTWTLQHPNVPKQRDEDDSRQEEQDSEDEDDSEQEEQDSEDEDDSEQEEQDPEYEDGSQHGEQDLEDEDCLQLWGCIPLMRGKWTKLKEKYAELMNTTWKNDKWRKARWGDVKWALANFYRSTLRMLWTVIAPELVMTSACDNLVAARENYHRMQKWAKRDKVTWSLSHSYLANMGGFVIRGKPTKEQDHHDPCHLTGGSILALRREGHIEKLPNITKAEIKDRSKGDILVKLISLGQIIWSIIQIIARAVRRLPVSPLEVAVVAFAVCAIFIYGLYWNKPQRVGVTQTIRLKEDETNNRASTEELTITNEGTISDTAVISEGEMPAEVYSIVEKNHPERALKGLTFKACGLELKTLPGVPISIDAVNLEDSFLTIVVPVVGAAVFGAIHAAAWNFAFPSTAELMMWRYASIYTTVAPFCAMMLHGMYHGLLEDKIDDISGDAFGKFVHGTTLIPLLFLYVVARLFIIVEMFRTLCFLPPESYISTWTSNIPHVG